MAVDDHGLEVLKKSGEEVVPGQRGDMYIKTKVINGVSEPIPVTVTTAASGDSVCAYGEIAALAAGIETTVATYTAPPATDSFLLLAEYSGNNIATYRVKINGVTKAKEFTWFNGPMSGRALFQTGPVQGCMLAVGDVVTVTAIHARPDAGDFSARILVAEV